MNSPPPADTKRAKAEAKAGEGCARLSSATKVVLSRLSGETSSGSLMVTAALGRPLRSAVAKKNGSSSLRVVRGSPLTMSTLMLRASSTWAKR
jgi:hypothetical protein